MFQDLTLSTSVSTETAQNPGPLKNISWNWLADAARALAAIPFNVMRSGLFKPLPGVQSFAERMLSSTALSNGTGELGFADIGVMSALAFGGSYLIDKFAHHAPTPVKTFLNTLVTLPMATSLMVPDLLDSWNEREIPDLLMNALTTTVYGVGLATNNREFLGSAAMLAFLFGTSGKFEDRFLENQEELIRKLEEQIPETVLRILPDNSTEEIPLASVKPGDVLLVPKGQMVPADSVIEQIEQRTASTTQHGFQEAHTTEALSATKVDTGLYSGDTEASTFYPGDTLFQGAFATDSTLRVRVTAEPGNSKLNETIRVIREAPEANHETTLSGLVDKYVFVLIAAVAAQFGLALKNGPQEDACDTHGHHGGHHATHPQNRIGYAISRALELAIKMAPCPLTASTLIYSFIARRLAGEHGIQVLNKRGLEMSGSMEVLLSDMTGTITEGKPHVTTALAFDAKGKPVDVTPFFTPLAQLELQSSHPLAQSVVRHARSQGLRLTDGIQGQEISGQGLTGEVNGQQVMIGRPSFIAANHPIPPALQTQIDKLESEGKIVSLFAVDNNLGVLGFEDPLRPGVKEAVQQLREKGVRVEIVTGSHQSRANIVAEALGGVDAIHAELLPEEKVAIIGQYKQAGKIVAMAGDGLNDAPAMVRVQQEENGEKPGIAFAIRSTAADLTKTRASMVINGIHQIPGLYDLSNSVNNIARNLGIGSVAWMSALTSSHFGGIKMGPIPSSVAHELPTLGVVALSAHESQVLSQKFADSQFDKKIVTSLNQGGASLAPAA